jgi:AraC family transcriptional regulator
VTVAKRLSTGTLHWARIGQARRFIRDHAAETLTLERIAAAAATSPYHFARIFRALTGETVFAHVCRVRLRKAVALLRGEPRLSVTEVATAVGYDTAPAFNKRFRKILDTTPTALRGLSEPARARLLARLDDPAPIWRGRPRVSSRPIFRERPDRRFLFVRRRGLCPEEAPVAWAEFHRVAGPLDIPGAEYIGAAHDDTGAVHEASHRYEAGLAVPDGTRVPKGLTAGILPGGRYAVFQYRGPYAHIGRAFDAIFRRWVAGSGVTLRSAPCLEIYRNRPGRVAESRLLTELCLPVEDES